MNTAKAAYHAFHAHKHLSHLPWETLHPSEKAVWQSIADAVIREAGVEPDPNHVDLRFVRHEGA